MKQLINIFVVLNLLLFAACGQKQIKTPQKAMIQFEEFKSKEKFVPDNKILYPGISDPALKPLLTERINLAADDFEQVAGKGNASEKEYLNVIKKGLERFDPLYLRIDTEDRERICSYFEELMDIVGLESSGGQLNTFMYGFDPT